jgi:hypothetical protein
MLILWKGHVDDYPSMCPNISPLEYTGSRPLFEFQSFDCLWSGSKPVHRPCDSDFTPTTYLEVARIERSSNLSDWDFRPGSIVCHSILVPYEVECWIHTDYFVIQWLRCMHDPPLLLPRIRLRDGYMYVEFNLPFSWTCS